jgi:hypothetical protein
MDATSLATTKGAWWEPSTLRDGFRTTANTWRTHTTPSVQMLAPRQDAEEVSASPIGS